ncbi:MAG: hypothetical protein ACYTGJ_10640 [Planctomycetota bacterium]|jgi:hypothetical protein
MQTVTTLPAPLLELPVSGLNLEDGPLGDQLRERTLLVLLRHLG